MKRKDVLHWLDVNGEVILCGFFFFAILGVITIQIFMRNIVGHGLQWAEEVTRYLHVWVTYIGIAYATRMNTHIQIDILQRKLPVKIRKPIVLIIQLVLLGLFALAFVGSVQDVITIAKSGNMAESMNISQNWMYMAAPIGLGLAIFRLIQTLVWKVRTFHKSWELFADTEGVYSGSLETFCYPEYVLDDMKASMTETAIKELEDINKKRTVGGDD